jgi:DNA-binding transcriptional MerR regulator
VRIKELAELTDVTVRTIRYYHQIGLLPVPQARGGIRDYDMFHVARVVRIRWLTRAGVELSHVAAMLPVVGPSAAGSGDAVRESVLADLHATLVILDEQVAQLRGQRARMGRLVAGLEQGNQLSPMPDVIARFYDDMESRATDTATRRAVRDERDFVELAFYRGDMPPESVLLYEGLSEAARAQSVTLFDKIAARSQSGQAPSGEEIEQIAAVVIDRISGVLGSDLRRVFRAIDVDVARRAADLYVRLSDQRQRPVDQFIADALVSAIEKEHLS